MKVQTPFVVVSLSEEGITSFIQSVSSSKSLYSLSQEFDDVFLFDSVSNRSFISLNQKFGANSGGMIELKLIDVPGEFEKLFFKSGIDNLIRISENYEIGDVTDSRDILVPEKLISEQIDYAKKLKNNFSTSILYIAYGVGSNLSYWNGPSMVQLVDAELDIDSSKIITLKLQPISRQLSTTNITNPLFKGSAKLNTGNFKSVYEGTSAQLDLKKYNGSDFYNSPFLNNTKYSRELGPDILYRIDLHLLICDTIRSYLKQACETDRVIVLLPDLNKLLSDLVLSKIKTNYVDYSESIFLEVLEGVLKSIGINLKLIASQGNSSKVATGDIAVIGEQAHIEESDTKQERIDNSFIKWKRQASIRYEVSMDFPTDLKEPIYKIFNYINEESGRRLTSYHTHYENNINVLNLWKSDDLRQYPMFANLPKDSNKSVVVFGDQGLITSFLLGQINLKSSKPSLSNFPLHPSDRDVLTNKKYNSDVRRATKLSIAEDDVNYNSLYDFNFDSFSIAANDPNVDANTLSNLSEIKEFGKKSGLPVFRYNIKNPNTNKLNHKFNPIYFTQLLMRHNRDVANTIANTFIGKFIEDYIGFGVVTKEVLAEYITQKQLLNDGLSLEEIQQELISKVNKSNRSTNSFVENFPNLIKETIEEIESNPDIYPSLNIPQGLPVTKEKLMYDFAREMYSKAQRISLETLPFFHINSAHILSGCFVFADIPQPTKSGNITRNNYNQFISGYYRINGFEHEISANECKSTFSLVKQLEVSNLNENDQEVNDDSFDIDK